MNTLKKKKEAVAAALRGDLPEFERLTNPKHQTFMNVENGLYKGYPLFCDCKDFASCTHTLTLEEVEKIPSENRSIVVLPSNSPEFIKNRTALLKRFGFRMILLKIETVIHWKKTTN